MASMASRFIRAHAAALRAAPVAGLGLAGGCCHAPAWRHGWLQCEEPDPSNPSSWQKAFQQPVTAAPPPSRAWSAEAREAFARAEADLLGAPSVLQRLGLQGRAQALRLDLAKSSILEIPKDQVIVFERATNRAQNAMQCVSVAAPGEPMMDYQYVGSGVARKLRGTVYFSTYAEGPPGAAHGGMIATMVDQAMGICIITAQGPCVTLNLDVNYKKFVPSGQELWLECWVEKDDDRKHWLRCQIKSLDGAVVHVDSTSLYLELRKKAS